MSVGYRLIDLFRPKLGYPIDEFGVRLVLFHCNSPLRQGPRLVLSFHHYARFAPINVGATPLRQREGEVCRMIELARKAKLLVAGANGLVGITEYPEIMRSPP